MLQRRREWCATGVGRAVLVGVLAVAVLVAPLHAGAQVEDAAAKQVEKLATDAAAAYKAADFTRAVELLERAYQIRQVAALLYNLAKAYDRLGDQEKAIELYRRYADSSDAEPKLRGKAEARVAAYDEAHKPKLGIRDNDPRVRDNDPRPPVTGQVEPKGPPPETAEARAIRLWRKGRSRDRIIGLTLMGVGVACALSGVGLSVSASLLHGSYNDTIGTEADKRAQRGAAKTQALAGDVLYGVAVVSAGLGAYFIWRGYHPEKPPRVNAWLTPVVGPSVGGFTAGLVAGGSF